MNILKVLLSSSDFTSSISSVGLILYRLLKVSCWAQSHIIDNNFCSPLDNISFASELLMITFISDLWGPLVVTLLLISLSFSSSRISSRLTLSSHPLKYSKCKSLINFFSEVSPKLWTMLSYASFVWLKKCSLFSERVVPKIDSLLLHVSSSFSSLSFRTLFLCFRVL